MVWGLYRHIGFRQEGGNTHTISLIFFLYRIMSIVCIPIVIVRAWFYCVQEPVHNKNILKLVPEIYVDIYHTCKLSDKQKTPIIFLMIIRTDSLVPLSMLDSQTKVQTCALSDTDISTWWCRKLVYVCW